MTPADLREIGEIKMRPIVAERIRSLEPLRSTA